MTAVTRLFKLLLPSPVRRFLRDRKVRFDVRHMCGATSIEVHDDDVVVTCLVKNGEYYLEQFIAHYTRLGVRHILLLDNLSTDQTVAIARRHPNVSVWSSGLSVGSHQGLLQRFLVNRTRGRGWCIQADIDEFFDFPGSDKISLRDFVRYLNRNRFTSTLTQMLDMFADEPLSYLHELKPDRLDQVYRFYDISGIHHLPYFQSDLTKQYGRRNNLAFPDACLFYGGVRKPMYGAEWYTNCLLTKHSLFRLRSKLDLFHHVHFVDRAQVADVSCVLLHYKLASNAVFTATQNRANLHGIAAGYNVFLNYLLEHPTLRLTGPTTRTFTTASELVEPGFLFASPAYAQYLASFRSADRPSVSTESTPCQVHP